MAVQTATLSEFLLDRIAEDEAEANYVRNVGVQGAQRGSINGALSHVIEIVLADGKAKRAIVAEHSVEGSDDDPICRHIANEDCPTLLALASNYADHADYRAEWAL